MPVPDEVTGSELDRDVRRELGSLTTPIAASVSRHLVMAGRLLDEDPQGAWRHAQAARRFAPRLAVVREACGLAAYRAGAYAEALAELRTARRLTGSDVHLPIMADCERGLGRPDRALALATGPEAAKLDQAGRIELRIVAAGARADLGQYDAAVVALQIPELGAEGRHPWLARLQSAYSDALADAGRLDEAREWLLRAAESDLDGSTGAAERLAELDGVEVMDLEEDDLAGFPPDEDDPGARLSGEEQGDSDDDEDLDEGDEDLDEDDGEEFHEDDGEEFDEDDGEGFDEDDEAFDEGDDEADLVNSDEADDAAGEHQETTGTSESGSIYPSFVEAPAAAPATTQTPDGTDGDRRA